MPKRTKVSDRMLRNLSSKLYHSDRRRNITAITAIALSAMLVMAVFSTIMSITTLTKRNQQMIGFWKQPELFMVTMNAPDADTLTRVEPEVRACLERIGGDDVVSYRSKGTYKNALEQFAMEIGLIGNGLAVVVGVMALVNFLNSTVSGIAERKEEFSTLQAIGMMKRLLLKVLRLENLYTVLWAVVPGYLIGHIISAAALRKASAFLPYIKPDTALLPGVALAAAIAGLSMIYPNRRTDVGDRKG